MGLNPFAPVSSYAEMLSKIAIWTFASSLGATVTLRWNCPEIDAFLGRLAVPVPIEDLNIPLGTALPAFAMALVSRIFKLHDRLSDVLGIRRRFDRQEILIPLAAATGSSLTVEQIQKVDSRRDELMGRVFYKYASSSADTSKIDVHYVILALDQWSWYWVVLEALFVMAISGGLLFFYGGAKLAVVAAWAVTAGIGLLQLIRGSCAKYAADEIREILRIDGASAEIRKAFVAL